MRVLLIKLSSMGDIIHTLPALTDAVKHNPNIRYTWVVEPAFQEIAYWHPAVEEIIALPLRSGSFSQIMQAVQKIRAKKYDVVIDAQGLLKSACLARVVRSNSRHGYDWTSCREGAASLLYNKKYSVDWALHAVVRTRKLFAQIFGYALDLKQVDYGVPWDSLTKECASKKPYLVFLHGTTWESKHWPDAYWVELAHLAAEHDFAVQVTWATAAQKARAQMLAQTCANVVMLPHLTLSEAATMLHHAAGVVAVDTGFAHLSAALDKPLVGIYGPTDVNHSGVVGNRAINLASKFACAPCEQRVCNYAGAKPVNPPCFQEVSPQLVWQRLQSLLV